MNEQDRKFVDSAKRLLEESVTDLDGATLSQLARARNRALAGRAEKKRGLRRPLSVTGLAASVLTTAALVLLVMFGPLRQDTVDENLVADLGLLTSEESLEFFEEIEFYQWISTVEEDEDNLSRVDNDRPVTGHAGPGLLPTSGDDRRDRSGSRNAGVSRLI